MPNVKRIIQRFRSAGPARTTRAIRTRAMRYVSHSLGSGRNIGEAEMLASIGLTSADPITLHKAVFGEGGARHFLDNPQATAERCRELFPKAVDATIAKAKAIRRHEFSFLGHDVKFDGPVDWFWCPETGGSWPFIDVATEKAIYGTKDKPGDIKFPWELNRHQHFVTLAKAWLYTGDDRYAHECADQLIDWVEKNPFPRGQNWLPMMELGVRSIAWLNAMWLFKDSEVFRDRALPVMLLSLYRQGTRLNAWMTEDWLTPNNHIIGETSGLFALATLLPCFQESSRWQKKALRVFTREITDQVCSDGVNKEQATGYHRFVSDFLINVHEIGVRNAVDLPEAISERLHSMINYQSQIVGPDGIVPMIGDCDDGRGIAITESVPFLDFSAAQALGAVLFDRDDCTVLAGAGNDEALWLLGTERFAELQARVPDYPNRFSTNYSIGGTAIMRPGNREAETMLLLRCGMFGFGGEGGATHSHGDMLAPVIYWKGQRLAVDTGTYTYYGDKAAREYARSAAAHNTFTPRGLDQGNKYPTWDWDRQPVTTVDEWNLDRATFTCKSGMGYTWTRTIAIDADSIKFEDKLDAPGHTGPMDWLLHLAPDVDAKILDNAIALSREGEGFVRLHAEGFDGWDIIDGWHSPTYGVRQPIRVVRLTVAGPSAEVRVRIAE